MKKLLFCNQSNIAGAKIKEHRSKLKLTQGDMVAQMQILGVNLDQQMLSKIEHGTRLITDYELACFAQVLKVDVADLVADFQNLVKTHV